jgi:REP element-mobilizing transposase RayT
MSRFKGQYRIESTRLPGWDYTNPGYYFVTICIRDHQTLFGEIAEDLVRLSPLGEIARQFWRFIPDHFPNSSLDEFIIMPNHVHGIVILHPTIVETQHPVETQHAASLQDANLPDLHPSQPASGSLSALIRSYKSAVKKWANENNYPHFTWQPRFYDHIVRDEKSLQNIRAYIRNNPAQWHLDRDNPSNIPNP